jgi:hypothetical protein
VFDNLDPNVQDRLKAYDSQSSNVLNKFERLLLAVTQRELASNATFENGGRNFFLNKSPVQDAKTGHYYFKSAPKENAHQYRFDSPLARFVIKQSLSAMTPSRELTFSIAKSERASTAVKALIGLSGELTVKVITFSMKAKNDSITESYMLAGAITKDGEWLDHEYVSDILDLHCDHVGAEVSLDESKFQINLGKRADQLQIEVQGRNSRYYDQQEELLYRNQQDRHAESEGKIREYRNKEKEARKNTKLTDNPLEQLKFKQEARKWSERAEAEDEDARRARKVMREEADIYLTLIEQSLKGIREIQDLFTIKWKIRP